MLEDARDSEGVLLDKNRLAYMVSVPAVGEHVIYDYIVGTLHRTTGQKDERAQLAIGRVLDSPQHFQSVCHGEFLIYRGGYGDVRQTSQNPLQLHGKDCAADPIEDHGVTGAHYKVGA